ncbi:MAG: glycine--tRNA ligase subunit beta [Syntrophomonadaceae bacterium]|nr:glycine--tRNA ligase subunit beta [Syntrophomonadaceae bacterium]
MTRDLLLEIGVEEMPSAYMGRAIADLKANAQKQLNDARLSYKEIQSYGTPRRLTLLVQGLEEKQPDALMEIKGPKKSIAFDQEGNPTKAGLGFARSQKVDFNNLEVREVGGVEYIFVIKKEKGNASAAILPGILLDIINSLTFPKSMRWGYYHTRFARPIRWLLALLGSEKIAIQVENIESSNVTYGHRFLSGGALEVNDGHHYFQVLRENYVILDQEERKELIKKQVLEVAAAAGGRPMENEDLLEEITYLLEYPTAFYGQFSPSYLQVPPEVLTTSMIEHQRYFPVFDNQGQLMPGFIGVRNGTDYSLDMVRAGNERVLKARLEDALFFWNEDTRKPLADMVTGLKEVLFHERLGSIMDKVERLQTLAVSIGEACGLSDAATLKRAALLCKADLVSSMVFEFSELQGIMGRYYAIKSGEQAEVSQAIFEHYLPRSAGDILPASESGKVLSLAEKIDNLAGCFAIGIKPSGSQDPYALRRQAMGIVHIILDSGLSLDLAALVGKAYDNFAAIQTDSSREDTISEVMEFIVQRMRGVLLERGYSYDLIDAALAVSSHDITDISTRIKALQELRQSEIFEDFMVVYNRCHNLTKKWGDDSINVEVLVDESEINLNRNFNLIKFDVYRSINARDYLGACKMLAQLRPEVDDFFNAVMVMVDVAELKAARLGLLKAIANLCNFIADFSKIVI